MTQTSHEDYLKLLSYYWFLLKFFILPVKLLRKVSLIFLISVLDSKFLFEVRKHWILRSTEYLSRLVCPRLGPIRPEDILYFVPSYKSGKNRWSLTYKRVACILAPKRKPERLLIAPFVNISVKWGKNENKLYANNSSLKIWADFLFFFFSNNNSIPCEWFRVILKVSSYRLAF